MQTDPLAAAAAVARVPTVLTIAGSDPSGGAGVQADLRTFAALGAYGCAVPTALTAQNTHGVQGVFVVPPAFVRAQLDALLSDVACDAVKIGMLGDAATVSVVAAALRRWRPPVVVLDPVVRSSSGAALLTDDGVRALVGELLPLATVVTPNAAEAGCLLRGPVPATPAEAERAAAQLSRLGPRWAVVTGGHLPAHATPGTCVDVLSDGRAAEWITTARRAGTATHGTGCTYASALAVLLARGAPMAPACRAAQSFVGDGIAAGARLRVGRGAGPVWQLGRRPRAG